MRSLRLRPRYRAGADGELSRLRHSAHRDDPSFRDRDGRVDAVPQQSDGRERRRRARHDRRDAGGGERSDRCARPRGRRRRARSRCRCRSRRRRSGAHCGACKRLRYHLLRGTFALRGVNAQPAPSPPKRGKNVDAATPAHRGPCLSRSRWLRCRSRRRISSSRSPKASPTRRRPRRSATSSSRSRRLSGAALKRGVRVVLVPEVQRRPRRAREAGIRSRLHPSGPRRARRGQGRPLQDARLDGRLHRVHGVADGEADRPGQGARRHQGSQARHAGSRFDHRVDGAGDAALREDRAPTISRS